MATADRQPAAPEAGPARRRHRRRPLPPAGSRRSVLPHGGPASQVAAALVAMAVGIFGAVTAGRLAWGSRNLGRACGPSPSAWWSSCCQRCCWWWAGTAATPSSSRAQAQTAVALVTGCRRTPAGDRLRDPLAAARLRLAPLAGQGVWRSSVVISVGTVAVFYVLFVVLLQIPLPRLV